MSAHIPDVSTDAELDNLLHHETVSPLPKKRGEPVFRDSWEAEAYAIGNLLVKEGYVLPASWMQKIASAIATAQATGDPDNGDTYYHHWCAALESICLTWIGSLQSSTRSSSPCGLRPLPTLPTACRLPWRMPPPLQATITIPITMVMLQTPLPHLSSGRRFIAAA
jgi:nitrile hydratase accessory protein